MQTKETHVLLKNILKKPEDYENAILRSVFSYISCDFDDNYIASRYPGAVILRVAYGHEGAFNLLTLKHYQVLLDLSFRFLSEGRK